MYYICSSFLKCCVFQISLEKRSSNFQATKKRKKLPFLKKIDVSLLRLETESCNSNWRKSGPVIEHLTLLTRLPYAWWLIQLTMATCFIFFNELRILSSLKDTVVCRDNRLLSELKNLNFSDSKI